MPIDLDLQEFQDQARDWTGSWLRTDGLPGPKTDWALAIADLPRWRRELIRVACGYHGVVESPIGSNRGAQVDAFLKPAGLSGVPWCAAFVSFCMREAGLALPRYHVSAKELLKALPPVIGRSPLPGDVFGWVNPDGTGHCGFVIGRAAHSDAIATIEGNSDNRVRCCARPRQGLQFGSLEGLLPAREAVVPGLSGVQGGPTR